jgi:hypothetical protein
MPLPVRILPSRDDNDASVRAARLLDGPRLQVLTTQLDVNCQVHEIHARVAPSDMRHRVLRRGCLGSDSDTTAVF